MKKKLFISTEGRRRRRRRRRRGRSQVLQRHDGISGEGYRAIAGALDGGSGVAAQLCS